MGTSNRPTTPKQGESPKQKRRSIRGRRSSIHLKTPAVNEQEMMEVSMKENVLETTTERISGVNDVRKRINDYKDELIKESADWDELIEKLKKRNNKEKGKYENEVPLAGNGCSEVRPTRQARSLIMKLLNLMRSQDDTGFQTQENRKLEDSCAVLNRELLNENNKIEQLLGLLREESDTDLDEQYEFWRTHLERTEETKKELGDLAKLLTMA